MPRPRIYLTNADRIAAKREQAKHWARRNRIGHSAGNVAAGPELRRDLELDRDARIVAAERRTPTQQFFGDPPPGYSALDQKQKNTSA